MPFNAQDMSSQPHLQFINPGITAHDEVSSFPLFPLLPKELRLKIWQHSLQRQRFINVRLKDKTQQNATQVTESTEPTTKTQPYCAIVYGYQVLSKLLRVSSESRQAALEFYRVHIPCRFTRTMTDERSTSPGTYHFNPEHDFLHITEETSMKNTLVDFLYHLKAIYDPRRVGLLNLAMDLNDLYTHHYYEPIFLHLDSDVRKAFLETLTQLHEVFFLSIERAGRQILGQLSGLPTSEIMFNRSLPIMAMAPTFERLHRDPRPIAQDLRKVFVGTFDPRRMLQLWLRLLKKWDVSPTQIQYRFLLTFIPTLERHQIRDRGSAVRWLQREDNQWRGIQDDDEYDEKADKPFVNVFKDLSFPIGAESEKYKDEDLERAVKPAFGFWLFPVDALGPLQEKGVPEHQGFRSVPKRMLDMTEHWPELALLNVP